MIILASQSPRRSEILRNAGLPFEVRRASVDESVQPHEPPEKYVKRIAQAKAMAVKAGPAEIVLGADTVVVIDGQIMGKPKDPDDALRMLVALRGRKHEVLTGVCLRHGKRLIVDWAMTNVWMGPVSKEEIAEYISTGEPMDKAGAYAIQGLASKFIQRIDGSYTNVVGLPVELVYKHLRTLKAAGAKD